MAHIVYAAPDIADFHLHERLRRELLRRSHRVTVLCCEQHEFSFWSEQHSGVDQLRRESVGTHAIPDEVLAHAGRRKDRRDARRLTRAAQRWFPRESPDLVLFHRRRTATASLLQFVARSTGSRVLWTGDGLLPHTMQLDDRGLDGDAGCRRWTPRDYRVVQPEPALLDAGLAHALAAAQPVALPRAEVQLPRLGRRCHDALTELRSGSFCRAWHALTSWRRAFAPASGVAPLVPMLDLKPPFVAVLLQSPRDPRLQQDAGNVPCHLELLRRTLAATRELDPDAGVLAVLPPGVDGVPASVLRLANEAGSKLRVAPASCAAVVASAAAVTVTVNHPLASAALLAGTPVVLLGRALFELPGVTTRATLATLPENLVAASDRDRPALRRRLLTWLLQHGHVWCSPDRPNHNGVLGLAEAVERRLATAAAADQAMSYRPGPTWPLATT